MDNNNFWADQYKLLDFGKGNRLEQCGDRVIVRPDQNALEDAPVHLEWWRDADAQCLRQRDGGYKWEAKKPFEDSWSVRWQWPVDQGLCHKPLRFFLRATHSRNIGLFPEHAAQWAWLMEFIKKNKGARVLNLFGYTGGASLAAIAAGAEVTHVDSSKAALGLLAQNRTASGLESSPLRVIHDDCETFVTREIKRGKSYDILIMDPPAFGRGKNGETFTYLEQVYGLLMQCKSLVGSKPMLVIVNAYVSGQTERELAHMLNDAFPHNKIETGELFLETGDKLRLSCALFGRATRK